MCLEKCLEKRLYKQVHADELESCTSEAAEMKWKNINHIKSLSQQVLLYFQSLHKGCPKEANGRCR